MPKTDSAPIARTAKRPQRFSLVPAEAQHAMYEALRKLNPGRSERDHSGVEVAKIAVCLAAGEASPVIAAIAARGVRMAGRGGRQLKARGKGLAASTVAAVDALLNSALDDEGGAPKSKKARTVAPAVAVICAGKLDREAEQDYRAAFGFAARHKLPILYLVGNQLSGNHAQLDLRSLYAEFGMPVFTVDAADAIAAYRVATEALHNARQLRGPCVIEALTIHRGVSPLELLAAYMERHGNSPRR